MTEPLFRWGEFRAHSGETLCWKIDCDALSNDDIVTIARIVSMRVGSFSDVEGVPRGGTRLARALTKYMTPPTGPLLIVDDVCTTGRSMEEHRAGRDAVGYVIFSRGGLPSWARALFTLDAADVPR